MEGGMEMKAWTVHSANTCQSQTMRVGRAKYPPYPVSFLSFCLFTSGKETKFDIHRSALLSNTEPVDEMRGHYCNKMAEVASPCFFVRSAFTLDSNLVGAGSQRKLNKEGVVDGGGCL